MEQEGQMTVMNDKFCCDVCGSRTLVKRETGVNHAMTSVNNLWKFFNVENCPHCGGDDLKMVWHWQYIYIFCADCLCQGPKITSCADSESGRKKAVERTIMKWNKRVVRY